MIVIAIAGGTASGKTTLSNKIVEYYKNFNVKYLSLDSYYKDFSNLSFSERSKINFDDPGSLDFDFFYQQINEYLNSKKYYDWNGSILVGSLKYMYLERLVLDQNNNVKYREKVAENIGRVRDVKISPDGFIYLAVDNKGIFKIVP